MIGSPLTGITTNNNLHLDMRTDLIAELTTHGGEFAMQRHIPAFAEVLSPTAGSSPS